MPEGPDAQDDDHRLGLDKVRDVPRGARCTGAGQSCGLPVMVSLRSQTATADFPRAMSKSGIPGRLTPASC